ncbi:MAG TPA: iron-containing alcohol dehydrogenase [Clostridia bacterium]|nr:iron-containing alcohol dehydrogenase [Clostridia bacterium]
MNNFEFYSPTKVIFGKGVENRVGEQVKASGASKLLVHFGGGSVKKTGLLDRVEASLKAAEVDYLLLGGVQPNPRLGLVHEGIDLCRKEKVDMILAVGGGSAIDSAKAIAMGVLYDGDVWDFYSGKARPVAALPTCNILTIAAAGSETSTNTVVTNEDGWMKRGFGSELLRPVFTLMNPELLYTLPAYQTACGVTDIIMHTFERFFSPGGLNEVTDRIAEAILRTVMQYGVVCVKEPKNYDARSEVMWAGSLSHNHLTGLGRLTDWATHQLEHELGGMFDVAHGAGLAAMWGAWARYVYRHDVMRFARYGANVLGLNLNYDNLEETALAAISATETYFKSLGMPINIPELMDRSLTEEEIKELAAKCTNFGKRKIGGFVQLGEQDIINIYREANKA